MSRIGSIPEPQKGTQANGVEQLQKQNPADTLFWSKFINNRIDLIAEEHNVDFEKFLNDSRKNYEEFCNATQDEFGNFSKLSFGLESKVDEVEDIVPIQQDNQVKNVENNQKKLCFSENARVVQNDSVVLKYEFIETEDGYSLINDGSVVAFKNKDAEALRKGYGAHRPDTVVNYSVTQDSKGFYYRGMSAQTHNILDRKIDAKATDIALKATIYRDLQVRQANGEELKDYERNFMQKFLDSLTSLGLQMNENNELEDIPVSKSGRRR